MRVLQGFRGGQTPGSELEAGGEFASWFTVTGRLQDGQLWDIWGQTVGCQSASCLVLREREREHMQASCVEKEHMQASHVA